MMSLRIVVATIILVIIAAFGTYVSSVFNERDELKIDVDHLNSEISIMTEKISALEISVVDAEKLRVTYLTDLEAANNETEKLRKCIDDKSCGYTIRVRTKTVCPADSTTGTVAEEAELDEESRRAYFDHREEINKFEALYGLCINTLIKWSEYGGR